MGTIAAKVQTITNTQDNTWLKSCGNRESVVALAGLSLAVKDVIARNTTNTIYNDGGSQLASLVLNGLNFSNTNYGVVYVKISDPGAGNVTVEVFKDSGLAAGNKICGGTAVSGASLTLTEANSSGASGTVVCTLSAADSDIYVNTSLVKYQKYDATGSNQELKGICESYNSTTGQLILITRGEVVLSKLGVTNGGGKEDLKDIGIEAV